MRTKRITHHASRITGTRMIRVNDKWDVPWQPGMTVRDVLVACEFTHEHVVVTVNGVLVPPGEYDSQSVADGGEVKVVHVIGGG